MICELSEAEILQMRTKVATAHLRLRFAGPVLWIEYADGPLEGLRSPVPAYEARCWNIAWCTVTSRGPVQVFYVQRDQPLVRYLDSMQLMTR